MDRTRHPPELGYTGLVMSADEFDALKQTRERYELISGVVVISPSPRPSHWSMVQEILFQVQAFGRENGGVTTYADIDLHLSKLVVYRPDLCVYFEPPPKRPPHRLTTVPDVVLEVLSPGQHAMDLVTKRAEYERFGVREYWVVNPVDGRLRAWVRDGRKFVERPVRGEVFASRALTGFTLDVRALRPLADDER